MITTSINTIIKSIADNEIVSIPTDTVYGLSCTINKTAIDTLINLKQRDSSKSFIIISYDTEHLLKYIDTSLLTNEQTLKLKTSQPQPTTWITPAKKDIQWLTGGKPTIAIRLVQTPAIQEICSFLDNAIISTSANISGQTSINNARAINNIFKNIYVLENNNKEAKPSKIINIRTEEQIR
jgi:L-threonylcarbamoyladenylate synthase